LDDELKACENDTMKVTNEIEEFKQRISCLEKEKLSVKASYEENKVKISDNNQLTMKLESQICSLKRDLEHAKSMNDRYCQDIQVSEKNLVGQAKRNQDLDSEISDVEADLKMKTRELEDLDRDCSKLQRSYDATD
jgi:chromosome segregation ATPase